MSNTFTLIDDTHGQTIDGTKSFVDPVRLLSANDATKYVALTAPATVTATWTLTLPPDDGTAGQVLQTDGAGVTSWASVSGGTGTPGGNTKAVQYNAGAGVFGGANDVQYRTTNGAVFDIGTYTDDVITIDPSSGVGNAFASYARIVDGATAGVSVNIIAGRRSDTASANAFYNLLELQLDRKAGGSTPVATSALIDGENIASQAGVESFPTGQTPPVANYGVSLRAYPFATETNNQNKSYFAVYGQASGGAFNFGTYGRVLGSLVDSSRMGAGAVGYVAISSGTPTAALAGVLANYGRSGFATFDPAALVAVADTGQNGAIYLGYRDATLAFKVDNNTTAAETPMLLAVAGGTPIRVSVGAADSGAAGFRLLRVPN